MFDKQTQKLIKDNWYVTNCRYIYPYKRFRETNILMFIDQSLKSNIKDNRYIVINCKYITSIRTIPVKCKYYNVGTMINISEFNDRVVSVFV